MLLELHNALWSCILVGCFILQPAVLFNVEHTDVGRMKRPKHVGANKWEKKDYTADVFVGLFFNNFSYLTFS
jgi:hypothetical protein